MSLTPTVTAMEPTPAQQNAAVELDLDPATLSCRDPQIRAVIFYPF